MFSQRPFLMMLGIMVCAAGLNLVLPAADAEGFTTVRPGGRGGEWEFFLPVTYAESSSITGKGGSSAALSSDIGMGFGLAYNINDRFAISGSFTWNGQSYDATVVSSSTGTSEHRVGTLDSDTFAINATYHLSDKDLTPFVSVGAGITTLDSNIPSTDAPIYSCWYDPYWGYICGYYTPTKIRSEVSYNAGVGVRWDASPAFGLRFGFYRMWIDYTNAAGKMPSADLWRMELLLRL